MHRQHQIFWFFFFQEKNLVPSIFFRQKNFYRKPEGNPMLSLATSIPTPTATPIFREEVLASRLANITPSVIFFLYQLLFLWLPLPTNKWNLSDIISLFYWQLNVASIACCKYSFEKVNRLTAPAFQPCPGILLICNKCISLIVGWFHLSRLQRCFFCPWQWLVECHRPLCCPVLSCAVFEFSLKFN